MGSPLLKVIHFLGNWPAGNISSAPSRAGSKYKRTFALQKSWNGGRINKRIGMLRVFDLSEGCVKSKSGKDARKIRHLFRVLSKCGTCNFGGILLTTGELNFRGT